MSVFKPASPYRSMFLSVTHYSNASVNVNGYLPIRIPIGAVHLQFLYRSDHLPPCNLFRLVHDRREGTTQFLSNRRSILIFGCACSHLSPPAAYLDPDPVACLLYTSPSPRDG